MILGLGHPRTGTRLTAATCLSLGLDVGHEALGKDGIVSWLLIKQSGPYPFMPANVKKRPKYKHLVYNVRNPIHTIPSIVYTENTHPISMKFRKKLFKHSANHLENTIDSILYFDNVITTLKPSIAFKVEEIEKLEDFLKINYSCKKKENIVNFICKADDKWNYTEDLNTVINKRKHDDFDSLLTKYTVSDMHKDKINSFCKKYQYEEIF